MQTWVQILVVLGLTAAAAAEVDSCGREKIWTVAIEHDWGAYAFSNDEGYFNGFSEELARMVCAAAGARCEIMYDSWTSCVSVDNNRMVLGDGLKQGMFDACLNALPTIERIHFAKFSLPYSKEATYNVYLNSDDDEPEDFTGLNVGFVKGWSADERCFQRCYGKALDKAQVKYVTGPADLSSMLNDGQIDLFMSIGKDHYKEVDEGKLKVARTCQCTLGDVSVIERKDSRFSDEVWNVGFSQIVLNGLYGELCKKWGQENVARQTDENGFIECLPYYNISDFRQQVPHWLRK